MAQDARSVPPIESTTTPSSAGSNSAEMTPTTASSPGTSRLLTLPPEILLNVLENTDLVAPAEVDWNPVERYSLPFRAAAGTAWKPPTALFLVSRAFTAAAQKVFLERNRFDVRPETSGFYKIKMEGEKSEMPQRYAASEFFEHAMDAGHLPLLRNLTCSLFAAVDREVAEEARRDWLDVLGRIKSHEGGELSLRTLSISGSWENEEYGKAWTDASKEDGIDQIRRFITDHIWCFAAPDGLPCGVTQQFWVEIRSDSEVSRYSIRKKDQDKANDAYWDKDWGVLLQLRPVPGGRPDDAASPGPSSGSQASDWVEEVWIRKIDQL
ncbi:hypothetical protein PG993_013061 [Apiospora rasikravindrae]|uniref:F-box domain-containing protein n=1 Tax=Apiospora rasikravindrae TaxID=990691 RepID=A0ABR1RYM5_9PEZI